jgi:DNA-binding response OmpR family regulator
MTIVFVDDDPNSLAILNRFTKKYRGIEAMTFTDSTKALAYLTSNKADLIVIDYSMPVLNGIDFIRAVRTGTPNETTPIVMVTSSSFESLKYKAVQAGATDFVTKPVKPDEFKTRVLDLLPGGP